MELSKLFSIKNSDTNKHKIVTILGLRIKLKICNKLKVTINDKLEFLEYLLNKQKDNSNFVEVTQTSSECFPPPENSIKLIAFYLPQFHDFKENIKWFGRGFSEWQNTSKAVPQFTNHWQPHIPIDVGYYNLEEGSQIIYRQIELAKQYGIYGFCYYYYWFSGSKIMEKPLERMLNDKSQDMPFFLFWANEDWTMLWDNGKDKEVLHKQEIKADDAEKFMQDTLPYMKDERYIKINNKPLLVIYQVEKSPYNKYISFNKQIREIAKKNGFDDLYIITTLKRSLLKKDLDEYIKKYNLDSMVEFFPQGLASSTPIKKCKIINNSFVGNIYNMEQFVNERRYIYKNTNKIFKGCFPNWDNTARKCYNGAHIFQSTPKLYKTWLKDIINWTKTNKEKEEQFVFINAWNEWAEGAHLEPDQKYGYAYLEATRKALDET